MAARRFAKAQMLMAPVVKQEVEDEEQQQQDDEPGAKRRRGRGSSSVLAALASGSKVERVGRAHAWILAELDDDEELIDVVVGAINKWKTTRQQSQAPPVPRGVRNIKTVPDWLQWYCLTRCCSIELYNWKSTEASKVYRIFLWASGGNALVRVPSLQLPVEDFGTWYDTLHKDAGEVLLQLHGGPMQWSWSLDIGSFVLVAADVEDTDEQGKRPILGIREFRDDSIYQLPEGFTMTIDQVDKEWQIENNWTAADAQLINKRKLQTLPIQSWLRGELVDSGVPPPRRAKVSKPGSVGMHGDDHDKRGGSSVIIKGKAITKQAMKDGAIQGAIKEYVAAIDEQLATLGVDAKDFGGMAVAPTTSSSSTTPAVTKHVEEVHEDLKEVEEIDASQGSQPDLGALAALLDPA